LAAAAASVLIGVVIYLVETGDHNFRVTKGEVTPQTTLVLGIVFGALLLAAALFGRRAPMGFMALFTFLAFGTRYLAGLPFLALAVWLLYRSFKFQKEATARLRAAKAEDSGSSPSASRSSTRSTRTKPSPKGSTPKGPGRPEANKRFTPKRPPPPPPKPSRRERKATQASD
jgi:putative Ca2+/H+ antiporter (TMEM165/GDT1 family)